MRVSMDECVQRPLELLAPAGGFEQLHAAIRFGADAVYLATERFGMRARAANFALKDLPRAVETAHEAGVAVHVACNVMMNGDDIDALPAYFRAVAAARADALIIGDLGALRLARTYAPDVAVHVSTQASVMNAQAALAYRDLGASRVVCAREMSLADIARMRAELPSDMEIEAFAHGAMCMAISGRCLISSYLTGRSGNKGQCTQPCRWSYTLEEEKRPGEHFPVEEDGRGTFIMNAKDMNMIEHVEALRAAGVSSLKIEGRNKKAFYVATVVSAYRSVIDGGDVARAKEELETVSHRPYGTGFYFAEAQQAPDFDGYEQTCMHVADVVSCDPSGALLAGGGERAAREHAEDADAPAPDAVLPGEGGYRITVRCRNRFEEGQSLEVLAPRGAVATVRVAHLLWHPDPTDDEPAPEPQPVAVANRSCNLYSFTACEPVAAGGFLRVRAYRRSARHA